jgi:hypothetical protein
VPLVVVKCGNLSASPSAFVDTHRYIPFCLLYGSSVWPFWLLELPYILVCLINGRFLFLLCLVYCIKGQLLLAQAGSRLEARLMILIPMEYSCKFAVWARASLAISSTTYCQHLIYRSVTYYLSLLPPDIMHCFWGVSNLERLL